MHDAMWACIDDDEDAGIIGHLHLDEEYYDDVATAAVEFLSSMFL